MGRPRKWASDAERKRASRGGAPPENPEAENAGHLAGRVPLEDSDPAFAALPPAVPAPPLVTELIGGTVSPALAGDPELELAADGTVLRSRYGSRQDYIDRGIAGAFPAQPASISASGVKDPGTPAEVFQERAAKYAAWRWDGFHRGEISSL